MWTRWCLKGRDPWVWTILWILEGRKKWTRPLLLVYWALLASISVAAWGRQLSRSRRYRQKASLHHVTGLGTEMTLNSLQSISAPPSPVPVPTPVQANSQADNSTVVSGDQSVVSNSAQNALGLQLSLPNLPTLQDVPNVSVSAVATDLLDAADKRLPTLGLNARRKFFHALAVVMFVPGIAFDVSFPFSWKLLFIAS